MPRLLDYPDLQRLAEERAALMGAAESDSPEKLVAVEDDKFRAWGIEPEAVNELSQWVVRGVGATAPTGASEELLRAVAFRAGFDLGMQAAQEVALRRRADDDHW